MDNFIEILRQHPVMAVFMILALGFSIGLIKIGNFKIGAALGTLFAGSGLLFGKYILKMDPVILQDSRSGAESTTTALNTIQDVGRKLPFLCYTMPYALVYSFDILGFGDFAMMS
jgi:uncharacterized transporter YbjL